MWTFLIYTAAIRKRGLGQSPSGGAWGAEPPHQNKIILICLLSDCEINIVRTYIEWPRHLVLELRSGLVSTYMNRSRHDDQKGVTHFLPNWLRSGHLQTVTKPWSAHLRIETKPQSSLILTQVAAKQPLANCN